MFLPVPYPVFFLEIVLNDATELNLRRRERYGKIYGTFFADKPVIMISDAEIVKAITIKESQNFLDTKIFDVSTKYFG